MGPAWIIAFIVVFVLALALLGWRGLTGVALVLVSAGAGVILASIFTGVIMLARPLSAGIAQNRIICGTGLVEVNGSCERAPTPTPSGPACRGEGMRLVGNECVLDEADSDPEPEQEPAEEPEEEPAEEPERDPVEDSDDDRNHDEPDREVLDLDDPRDVQASLNRLPPPGGACQGLEQHKLADLPTENGESTLFVSDKAHVDFVIHYEPYFDAETGRNMPARDVHTSVILENGTYTFPWQVYGTVVYFPEGCTAEEIEAHIGRHMARLGQDFGKHVAFAEDWRELDVNIDN